MAAHPSWIVPPGDGTSFTTVTTSLNQALELYEDAARAWTRVTKLYKPFVIQAPLALVHSKRVDLEIEYLRAMYAVDDLVESEAGAFNITRETTLAELVQIIRAKLIGTHAAEKLVAECEALMGAVRPISSDVLSAICRLRYVRARYRHAVRETIDKVQTDTLRRRVAFLADRLGPEEIQDPAPSQAFSELVRGRPTDGDECAICSESLAAPPVSAQGVSATGEGETAQPARATVVSTPECKHWFHLHCLVEWVDTVADNSASTAPSPCPLCRHQLSWPFVRVLMEEQTRQLATL